MSGAAREKDQADFDLERLIDMFDEALTSRDPRVIDTLRSLMMIVTLTKPESRDSGLHDRNSGPLRRLYEDVNHLHRRVERVEGLLQREESRLRPAQIDSYHYPYEKFSMQAAMEEKNKINQDMMNRFKAQNAAKVKGLLDK